jgi:aspartyl-tRNA(Asn)/glutamyl-tRNA(Gln) amidotransferase subunit C
MAAMAPLSREEVAHVARLARLQLTDEQIDVFTPQLAAILDHAADVEALQLDDVPPTAHPYPLANVMRPDVARDAGIRDAVLAEAPAAEAGMFRVPAVLGEEP